MRFIHTADLHCTKERLKYCLEALAKIREKVLSYEEDRPVVLIAGDIWDAVITNGTVFAQYVAAIKAIIDITDVYIIYGTPTHEIENSLDVFEALGAHVYRNNSVVDCRDWELIAIPEPRRCDYIKFASNMNQAIKDAEKKFIESLLKKTKTRVVMYHGEIDGCVRQNGTVVETSDENYSINKAVLKKANADYYAFGHIHLPQKVTGLNEAYYAGSIYGKDSGEHHNPGYNFVTIADGKTEVEFIHFDFPMYVTEEITEKELDKFCKRNYENKNLTVKLTLDKALSKKNSKIDIANKIKESTGALSVKVHFNYLKIQSVRNVEISQQTSIKDKFLKYAEFTGIDVEESVLQKLEDIQNTLLIERFIPNDTFELVHLSLRGSIGIKEGQGLEEIDIDFTKFNEPIVALTGAIGAGKSTLIENCHPYPQLLTRPGTLKDQFYLKDSHRIITYKTNSGKLLRISMFIDGVAVGVSTRYLVETKEPDGEWTAYRSCDGTVASYKVFLESTFGSLELFLRTAFYAKEQIKTLPDLSRANKSEKMALFSVLVGTDYLSEVVEKAKLKIKEEKEAISNLKGSFAGYDNVAERINTYKQEIEEKSSDLKKFQALIDIDKEELAMYLEDQKKYDEAVLTISTKRKESIRLKDEIDNLERKYMTLNESASELWEQLSHKEEYEKQIDWYNDVVPKKKDLCSKRDAVMEEINKLRDSVTESELKSRRINESILEIDKVLYKAKLDLKALEDTPEQIDDVCPVCGQKMTDDKLNHLKQEQESIKKNIQLLKTSVNTYATKKENLLKELNSVKESDNSSELKKLTEQFNKYSKDISLIDTYMSQIDIAEAKNVIQYAEPRYNQIKEELDSISNQVELDKSNLAQIETELEELPVNYSDKINRLNRGIEDSRDNISRFSADIRILEDNLKSLKVYEKQVKEIGSKLETHESNISDYELIQSSFGNNGIQAIELDSAAPEISDITNSILYETFGERFTVSFDTQRDTKDKRKIDDFIINVFDAESGREKTLDLLSSGEGMLVKQALYYAFSVIRTRKTGFCFKTRFLDESDGSIDTSTRPKYIKMVEAAHNLCNASLTVLITHSQEVKDLITQKIEF